MQPDTAKVTTKEQKKEARNAKKNANKRAQREEHAKFVQMVQDLFPQSGIHSNNIASFLFRLAGYDYDSNFNVTKCPSKFKNEKQNFGYWQTIITETATSTFTSTSLSSSFPPPVVLRSSLLENQRFIDFVNSSPLCDYCGGKWFCQQSTGKERQVSTNGRFVLECTECGLKKHWTTQTDNFLDNLLWVACKLSNTSPTKMNHVLRMLQTGGDKGHVRYCGLIRQRVEPTLHQLYDQMQKIVINTVKDVLKEEDKNAIISWDGTFSNRNRNSDHVAVTFIEHNTGMHLLLHLETLYCDSNILPQGAESKLIQRGYE